MAPLGMAVGLCERSEPDKRFTRSDFSSTICLLSEFDQRRRHLDFEHHLEKVIAGDSGRHGKNDALFPAVPFKKFA
jgi:hypothetical protein